MIHGPSDEPGLPPVEPPTAADAKIGAPGAPDCRTCDLRQRCISYGWMSPGGIWFENAVILAPKPGCRGFVGRGDEIRARFVAPLRDLEH